MSTTGCLLAASAGPITLSKADPLGRSIRGNTYASAVNSANGSWNDGKRTTQGPGLREFDVERVDFLDASVP